MAINKTFEDKLQTLESIIKELESDIALDSAIQKYEDGMKLANECQKELQVVEKKIMKIVEADGQPQVIPVEEHEFPTLF